MLRKLTSRRSDFYQTLFSLVLPFTVQNFMLSLVSATDAIMLGMVDQTSLSAVSLAGQVQFVLSLFISGISIGAGILVAQYWGKRDVTSTEQIMPIALRVLLLCGGLFTVSALVVPGQLMACFTNDAQLIAAGADYLKAVALSYVMCAVSQLYLILLKNTGRAGVSSLISSTAVVVNIVLNAVLILGLFGVPALGIRGAAYATVAARLLELLWALLETKRAGEVQIRWRLLLRTDRTLAGDFWRYSLPVLGASVVWGFAYCLYSVIMGHLGSDAVAAYSIANIAKNLISCLVRGIGGGAGIMVGNLLGRGEMEKAKDYARRLTHLSILVGSATGLLLVALSPLICHLVPLEPAAAGYLQQMFLIAAVNLAALSVNVTVLDGIFCAGGDSRFDMKCNLFGMWCFVVPVGFLTAFWLKLPVIAVFFILNLDELVKLPAVFLHYKKYIWVRDLTRSSHV